MTSRGGYSVVHGFAVSREAGDEVSFTVVAGGGQSASSFENANTFDNFPPRCVS